ncbi:MAG: ABC transporter ATP-binding protein [Ruminococcaceae bacterium]|nr:ABC transporter ATP-binding protein [Oscillospiraceae bacterium]
MISITGLSKTYSKGGKPAVDDLDLFVNDGEIFGFIGPNGAGKSTTIKMLTGIIPPDSGSVVINGEDMIEDPVEAKKLVGYVPDSPDLYERLTGIEYLDFLGDIYEVPTEVRQDRIKKYADMFEMSENLNDQIKSYSHGMRQKIVVMGALLHDPEVWILDEPMVGLDPRAAHLLKEEMRNHCKKGNTVFFSTHVLEVAEKLCDRIGIISHGKLVATGTIEELREKASQDGSLESIFLSVTGE